MAEGTDFIIFLKAIASGKVYYDPAIKLEKASADKPLQKRIGQFRVKVSDINSMFTMLIIIICPIKLGIPVMLNSDSQLSIVCDDIRR